MKKYQDNVVQSRAGILSPLSGAVVTIANTSGGASTMYSDNGITVVPSVVTDANGFFSFYAADGTYTITITGAGATVTRAGVEMQDTLTLDGDIAARPTSAALAATTGAGLIGSNDGAAGTIWTTVAGFISKIMSSAGAAIVGDNTGGTSWTTVKGFITYLLSSAGSSVVGFIQAGTGAVARTAQAKNREIVSVTDFGADITGAASAVTAFQNAINSTPNSGVQVIHVPRGTYSGDMTQLNYGNRDIVWDEEAGVSYTTAYPVKTKSKLLSLNGQLFGQSIVPRKHLKQFSSRTCTPGAGFIGVAVLVGGALSSVTITNGGANYVAPRGIVIGDGTGAVATPTITGGVVTGFTITGGTGYTTAQVLVIEGPIVVCVGDSIMTPVPNQTVPSDCQYDIICRTISQQNPHHPITFFNRAVGGQTWTGVNQAIPSGANYPTWAQNSTGGTTTKTWINYIVELQPDLIVWGFGMNDRQNFVPAQMRACVTNAAAFNSQAIFSALPAPDQVFVTNTVASAIYTADPNMSSNISQIGRDDVAGYVRGYALSNGYGFVDLHRQFRLVRDGIDVRQTALKYFTGATAVAWLQNPTNVWQPAFVVGAAQGGGTNTITLAAGSSSTTNDPTYVGATVCMNGGNSNIQSNVIVSYDGPSKVATLAQAWVVSPVAGDPYAMVAPNQSGEGLYLNATIDCSVAGFWTNKAIELQLSADGNNFITYARISDNGAGLLQISVIEYNGNVVAGVTPLGVPYTQSNTVTTASTPNTVGQVFEIGCHDQRLSVTLNGVSIYSANIAKGGGVMQPLLRYVDITAPAAPIIAAAGITPVINSHAVGQYAQYQSRLTDYEIFGYASNAGFGGNQQNHPSTLAINHIFAPVFMNSDFSVAPVISGGGTVATAYFTGVHEPSPRAIQHITKNKNTAATLTPPANANNQLLEDASNVGQSLMTNSTTGVTRWNTGNEVNAQAFTMAYVHSTGLFTWAQNGTTLLGLQSTGVLYPNTDNTQSLGTASKRWSVVYAGTGTINTSDERDKQQIRSISAAEKSVALNIKGMLKAFKFNSAVATKGDGARIHFGVMAQDIQQAFIAGGLDPDAYGVFCYDKWDASPAIYDDDGELVQDAVEAGDKMGVRYDELFAFILAS